MTTPAPRERVELTPGDLKMLRRVEARRQRNEAREVQVAALVARVKRRG